MEFIGFIINVAITVFLAIDASKHSKSGVLWGILGFLFGPIALGIYLIRTDRKTIGWVILIPVGIAYILFILFIVAAVALFFSI